MKSTRAMKSLISALAIAMLGLVSVSLASSSPSAEPAQAKKINHYIGAAKCKNCHAVADNGAQYDCWTKSKHAEAFKTLGGDAAKKIAAEKKIEDAQKSDACLKCHVTGFGLAEDQFKKGFDRTAGVQCETCHGPGEAHASARMAAAAADEKADPKVRKTVPDGEILIKTGPELCLGCHNSESPSFKNFCYAERLKTIAHYDPRGDRKAKAPACKCPEGKCSCAKADCSKEEKK